MALGHALDKASQALKQFVHERELDQLTGRKLAVRVKRIEPVIDNGRGRRRATPANPWRMQIDFRWPVAGDDRPVGRDGGTSFHLRVETYSRPASATRSGASSASSSMGSVPAYAARMGSAPSGGAATFDAYVADARRIDGGGFERYVGDGAGAVEAVAEQAGETTTRVVLLTSTIADDPAARDRFWRTREDKARRPGAPTVELHRERASNAVWQALAAEPDLPVIVREGIVGMLAAGLGEGGASDAAPAARPVEIVLATDADIAWASALGTRFGNSRAARALHYRAPRGGRVQERVDLELPDGLGMDEIAVVVGELGHVLDGLKVAYTIAVHRPDHLNDPRNWHMHLVFFPQPGERDAKGEWRFDTTHPLRPGELARALEPDAAPPSTSHHRTRAATDLAALRRAYASIVNAVLERGGHARRFDPRSYVAMGIDQNPAVHFRSAEARLAAAGVATVNSRVNAEHYWAAERRRRLAAIAARFDDERRQLQALMGVLVTAPDHRGRCRTLVRALEDLVADRQRLVEYGVSWDAARSRAVAVERYCARSLAAIVAAPAEPGLGDAGRAKQRRRDDAPAIARRRDLARHHLAEIDAALEPFEAELDTLRRDLVDREHQLRGAVAALHGEVHAVIRAGQESESETVVDAPAAASDVIQKAAAERAPAVISSNGLEPAITHSKTPSSAPDQAADLTEFQWLEVARVIAAITTNGREATATATRGRTDVPRRDAVLYERYRNHPYVKPRFAAAQHLWTQNQTTKAGFQVAATTPEGTILSVGSEASTTRPDVPVGVARTVPAVPLPSVASAMPMPEKSDRPSATPLGSEHRGPSPAEPVPIPRQAANVAPVSSAPSPAGVVQPSHALTPAPPATKPLPAVPMGLDSGAAGPQPGAVKHPGSNAPGHPTAGSSSMSITARPGEERPGREGIAAIKAEEASRPPRRDETETTGRKAMRLGATGAKKSAAPDPMITMSREDGSSAEQPADAHRSPDAGKPVATPVVSAVDTAAAGPSPAAEGSTHTDEAEASSAASACEGVISSQRAASRMDRLRDAARKRATAKPLPNPVASPSKASPAGESRNPSGDDERQSGRRQKTVEEKQRVAETAAVPDPDDHLAWLQQQRDWKNRTGQGR